MNTLRMAQSRNPVRSLAGSLVIATLTLSIATNFAIAETEAEQSPTDVLRKEHKIIHKMAKAAKQDAKKIQQGSQVDAGRIAKYHDFFKNFADRCHHAKEEDELFPLLRKMDVDPVIIDLLVQQHKEGRILLRGIEDILTELKDKGKEPDRQALGRYILEYAELMERHIRIENEYLWHRVAERLSETQKATVAEAFHRIETEELGKGFHEKYHTMAMEILGKKN